MFHVEPVFLRAGLRPSAAFLEGAEKHLADIYRWNKVHDLTAVPESEAAERHALDSILPFKEMAPPATLLDVGSGAGFPGIPLALWWPDAQVTLLEPLRKRRSFLENEGARLGLTTLVRGEPIEQLKGMQFDLVTSRATLPWEILLSACRPAIKPGGRLVGLLGPEQSPSARDLERIQGWKMFHVERYRLPSGAERVALHCHVA